MKMLGTLFAIKFFCLRVVRKGLKMLLKRSLNIECIVFN